jgi:hypothetical protein
MIYRHCYHRPLAIEPGMYFYRRRLYRREIIDGERHKKYSIFQYHWEGQGEFRPRAGSVGLPTKDGTLEGQRFCWRTAPTLEQEDLIASGATTLPYMPSQSERSSGIHQSIVHDLSDPDKSTPYIMNSQCHYLSGFINIPLLRSCTTFGEKEQRSYTATLSCLMSRATTTRKL